MRFSLAKLVIWPRDESKAPRVVSFQENGINLITGFNRSGKSAIIKIVDYCLGSGTCKIPRLGPIRRSSAWYGVIFRTEEGYKLFARRDPGNQESTDDCMILEGGVANVPERPTQNANRAALQGLLARLARLPQATADFDATGSGYRGRASFADMTTFMFQPQSIIANENVLFFEADDDDHARKIREIFPLVLGAVDADTLVKQHRLADVRRLLERKRRQLEVLRGSAQDYAGEVRGRYLNAIDLGFLSSDVATLDQADISVLLARLKDLTDDWLADRRPVGDEISFTTASRLAELRQRESFAAQQVASLRLRQVQLRELSQARHLSEGVLARERDRLAPVSWLVEEVSQTTSCPFCGSENPSGTAELTRLRDRARAVEAQWRGFASIPPMLDAEEVAIRRARTEEEDRLRQIRAERLQLESQTAADLEVNEQRAVFLGKLQEFLRVQQALSGDIGLETEIADLEAEETDLRMQVDGEVIAQRKEDALLLFSRYAQHYGRIVELENNDAIIKLDTRELSIRVINERGESAWLYQIGSGANYLGYHVATMLALHEFFIFKPIPYVPSVLIFDQPSQTQFPDDMDEDAEQEEMRAVHKAFEAFQSAVARTNGQLQIIVSDHAGATVYSGIREVTVVERWRRGRKLIPWHWDAEAFQGLIGQRADGAVEDLMDTVVRPAIVLALGLGGVAEIIDFQIDSATFTNQGIEFQVTISKVPPREDPRVASSAPTPQIVSGAIRQDLSVSIA